MSPALTYGLRVASACWKYSRSETFAFVTPELLAMMSPSVLLHEMPLLKSFPPVRSTRLKYGPIAAVSVLCTTGACETVSSVESPLENAVSMMSPVSATREVRSLTAWRCSERYCRQAREPETAASRRTPIAAPATSLRRTALGVRRTRRSTGSSPASPRSAWRARSGQRRPLDRFLTSPASGLATVPPSTTIRGRFFPQRG